MLQSDTKKGFLSDTLILLTAYESWLATPLTLCHTSGGDTWA